MSVVIMTTVFLQNRLSFIVCSHVVYPLIPSVTNDFCASKSIPKDYEDILS